ncbi:iq calmodulin-binding motif family protein [Stylonychia lemnae]|uniref:Iq calmodulin-binding motif family protein n=1 Tax=Stylonychia lemnae TaxID=5949 RepID=A0A078BB22_STYLE|nr:iq calmodulin-binding motif family protein [Stylonychia lemnae]|eukprot:CDW91381.1 iq calmodulin-binding motif family protein [Stylonychia lemnae]
METLQIPQARRPTLLRRNLVLGSPKNYSLFDQYVTRGKVLKNFNIDPEQYKLITDPEEKKQFILHQAETHLQEQVQQFNDHIKKKQKWIESMKIQDSEEKNRSDQYPWLHIKAPHKANLEWRLKNELMQKLQVPQSMILKTTKHSMKSSLSEADVKLSLIRQNKDLLSSGAALQEAISSTFKDFVNTFEQSIKDNPNQKSHAKICSCNRCRSNSTMFPIKNAKHSALISAQPIARKLNTKLESMIGTDTVISENILGSSDLQVKERPMTSKGQDNRLFKDSNLLTLQAPPRNSRNLDENQVFVKKWSDFDEMFYRSYRSEMRERLANESRTGPWEQVMLGFLRKIDKPQTQSASPKVNSIPALNNCIDRNYIQKKLSLLSQDQIDQIETDLAEKIITEYEDEKKVIKGQRYEYLKNKGKNLIEKQKQADQKKLKESNMLEAQKEHKMISKRMRIILNGLDKKLIDIKKKPATKFDFLYKNKYPYNNPLGQQVKMKIPSNWDSYKTLMLFDNFKEKPNEKPVPIAKKIKYSKENPMEYFAQKFAGGPLKFDNDDEKKKASIKVIMNAIKMWKSKKSVKVAQKKFQEKLQNNFSNSLSVPNLLSQLSEATKGLVTYSDLQKAIFNNDVQWIKVCTPNITEDVINKLNLENNTCLYEAVKFRMHNIVKALLGIPNININQRCEANNTALHIAFQNKDVEMIKLLVENKANAELINMNKKIPCQMVEKVFLKEIGFNPVTNNFK